MVFRLMFAVGARRWRMRLSAAVLAIASSAILSASAQAVTNPVWVTVHNRTGHNLLIGPSIGDSHRLGAGKDWQLKSPESPHKSANTFRLPPSRTQYCGELKFVNPALGYPYAELLRDPEHPDKGVRETFRFAVDEEHTFHYDGSQLIVKRIPDAHEKSTFFGTLYKRFDVRIERC
jgi:hypothetical protein